MATSNNCLNRFCRTCLSTKQKLKCFNNNEELLKMITQWTPIKPKEDDMLSKQICVVCISKLNLIHKFIQTCTNADNDLRQAIEENNQTFLNKLQTAQTTEMSDSNSDNSDSECDSFSLSSDGMLEIEEHQIDFDYAIIKDEVKNETNFKEEIMEFRIVNVETVPENEIGSENTSFEGFHQEEIKSTNTNFVKYTETLQTSNFNKSGPNTFFDSIENKCYLCDNKLDLETYNLPKPKIKTLVFSNLEDDAHVLCKLRIKILRKLIGDLYWKQNQLTSLNSSWHKYFLQQKINDRNVAETSQQPAKQVPEKHLKPPEIGHRRNGKVYVGHLIWVPETEFDEAFQDSLNPHKFISNMALILFGTETLAKSTIYGIGRNGIKKEPLHEIRLCALKSSVKYYMKEHKIADLYQEYIWKNFNKILGRKIFQISAEYKKQCSREI